MVTTMEQALSMYVVPVIGGYIFIWASSAKEAHAIADEQERTKEVKR